MKSTEEKRLFGRIVVLTFILGLVSGPWGWLIGTRAYHFIRSGFDPLANRPPGWPLDDFQIILGGAFFVLFLTVSDLCTQFLMGPQMSLQWKNNRHAFVRFCGYFAKIQGFLWMSGGFIFLLCETQG